MCEAVSPKKCTLFGLSNLKLNFYWGASNPYNRTNYCEINVNSNWLL